MARPSAAGSVRRRAAAGALLAALLSGPCSSLAGAAVASALSPAERVAILELGPWPPGPLRDPSNPASNQPAGIALGEQLFHSPRLSPTGLRCASCHEPWRHFADGRGVAQGVAAGSRNTPSLLDAARHRHFGWDGARDALWLQSLRPLRDAREMPASDADVASLVRADSALATRYAAVFGGLPDRDDARVTRDVGLALAAYVETLVTPRTPFDDWRDRLATGAEPPASAAFADAARRGLRLFVGRGGCSACHAGPTLGDDGFHASLVHSLGVDGTPDPGHADALANAFRTPGLRGAAATPPYFHDGSAARLSDAIRPHATLPGVVPASLTRDEIGDIVAFLRTLSTAVPDDPPSR